MNSSPMARALWLVGTGGSHPAHVSTTCDDLALDRQREPRGGDAPCLRHVPTDDQDAALGNVLRAGAQTWTEGAGPSRRSTMRHLRPHNRSLRRSLGLALAVGGAASFFAFGGTTGCGVDDEIVGGACDPGYSRVGNTCVVGGGDAGTDGLTDSSRDGTTDGRRDGTTDATTDGKTGDAVGDSHVRDGLTDGTSTDVISTD